MNPPFPSRLKYDELIPQLDGNFSLSSSVNSSILVSEYGSLSAQSVENSWYSQLSDIGSSNGACLIPVFVGLRSQRIVRKSTRQSYIKTIKRDNKFLQASNVPVILSYNMRSLWCKFDSLANDMV